MTVITWPKLFPFGEQFATVFAQSFHKIIALEMQTMKIPM